MLLSAQLRVPPTDYCLADHLNDLAGRHPDVREMVVRCDPRPRPRPEDKTLEAVCEVLTAFAEGHMQPFPLGSTWSLCSD